MKPILFAAILFFLILAGAGGYIATQEPRIWCDAQSAGLAMCKGGYRAWTVSFCDGKAFLRGQWRPCIYTAVEGGRVVLDTNGVREGFYTVPRFRHCDLKCLGIPQPPTNGSAPRIGK